MTELSAAAADAQFVTLGVDREVFALPVEVVLEILDMRPMFRIPEAPPYLAGLIDVRGRAVPVIDLRVRLGLAPVAPDDATRIVVLQAPLGGQILFIGLIAERVFEVAPLDEGGLQPAPEIGVRWRSDHIRGVGRRGDSFVVVFDLERLFASDAELLGQAASAEPALSDADPAGAAA